MLRKVFDMFENLAALRAAISVRGHRASPSDRRRQRPRPRTSTASSAN